MKTLGNFRTVGIWRTGRLMLEKECVVKAYSEINSFAMRVRLPCRLQKEDKISCPLFVINYNIGTLFLKK